MYSLLALGGLMETRSDGGVALAGQLLRVRDRRGRRCRLVANPAQRRFEQRRGRENVILKARQMGMTTWVAGRFFLRTLTRPGTTTLLVAHTRESAEAIFATVRRMWAELPEHLQKGELRLRRDTVGGLLFEETGSAFRVASASDPNAGRGLSLQNLHCSEVSRWPGDAAATLAGLRAALAPDGELVLESTPSGAHGAFYQSWMAAVDGPEAGAGMVRHFLPWWLEPAYAGAAVGFGDMTDAEIRLASEHGLSGQQIGFRRGLEVNYGSLRSQEFAEDAETCFRATGACCFELAAVERRLSEAPEPAQLRRNGTLRVWLPPVAGRRYVVAADTAGGGEDGDFAAVEVVDVTTGLQCAEFQARVRPAELAQICAALAREYGGALLAVERNNHGAAVLAFLETAERYERVYRQGGQQGWLTSAVTKPEAVARLGTLLAGSPERFMSRWLLAECRSFVADERGRAGAAGGAHDDLVMAMAIAQAVRAEVLAGGAVESCGGR